ncbi:MAG: MerR family transcriptional regulator [Proteobacteria bacterium]|nr:MAG: MerR family transcriptional regulator [Pseudomonadota bacterium]
MASQMVIGQLARKTGCKVTTIRYYEKIGLLPEPARSEGGTRRYDAEHLARLGFIQHCRELGFSQSAIRELLHLKDRPDQSCETVTGITRKHLEDVERKISRLMALKAELQHMIAACDGGSIAKCRLVEALADHSHAHCLQDAHPGAVPG